MELTKEKSEEMAKVIEEIKQSIHKLNVEYLKEALSQMESSLSKRESAMILAPNPHTVMQSNDLDSAKNKWLGKLIELCEASDEIINKELELAHAKFNSSKIAQALGF